MDDVLSKLRIFSKHSNIRISLSSWNDISIVRNLGLHVVITVLENYKCASKRLFTTRKGYMVIPVVKGFVMCGFQMNRKGRQFRTKTASLNILKRHYFGCYFPCEQCLIKPHSLKKSENRHKGSAVRNRVHILLLSNNPCTYVILGR